MNINSLVEYVAPQGYIFESKPLHDGDKVLSTRPGSKAGSPKSKALEMVKAPSVTATFYAGGPQDESDGKAPESFQNIKTEQTYDNRMGATSRVDDIPLSKIEALLLNTHTHNQFIDTAEATA